MVPLGHEVPASWSTNTSLPLTSVLLQHPCTTPEPSTGLELDITAAVAILDPAAKTTAVAPAMMTLRLIMGIARSRR